VVAEALSRFTAGHFSKAFHGFAGSRGFSLGNPDALSANTRVVNSFRIIRTTTDNEGRYRLVGLPKTDGMEIGEETWELPYLSAVKKVDIGLGLETVTSPPSRERGFACRSRIGVDHFLAPFRNVSPGSWTSTRSSGTWSI
jgi:hypothetical protein